MTSIYLPAGVTALLCAGIMFVCICRLDKIDKAVRIRVGIQYVILLMAAAGLAAAPLLWQFHGWAVVWFAGAVLFMLIADSFQWAHGAPTSTISKEPPA